MKKIYFLLTVLYLSNAFAQKPALGLIFSTPEKLEKVNYAVTPRISMGPLPRNYTLTDNFPPIQSQGQIGSCSSWASVYCVRSFIQKTKEGYEYSSDGVLDNTKVFSPLYVFNQVKNDDPRYPNRDCARIGSYIVDNLDYLLKKGVCTKKSFDPDYKDPNCRIDPLQYPKARNEAPKYKINNYGFVIRYDETYKRGRKLSLIKQYIANGYPLVIGTEIDSLFWVDDVTVKTYEGKTIKTWDSFDETHNVGGHAMVIVGYNDDLRAIKVYNSWGTDWGNDGYGWMSYDIIDDHLYEAFVVNVENDRLLPSASLTAPSSQMTAPTEKKDGKDYTFFIKNRFQPFNGLRFMPVDIDKANNKGIIKVYEIKPDSIIQVDVFEVKKDETYTFINKGYEYKFKLDKIEPWRFLGRPAIYFFIEWSKKN